jgi:hypothetical protein
MSEEIQNDDALFDRLVDGELSEAERHWLLTSLDGRPDGWRRCALAFLEAQSWTGHLRQLISDSISAHEAGGAASRTAPPQFSWRRGVSWFAIAASMLIAFSLGSMQRGPQHLVVGVPPATESPLVAVSPPPSQVAPQGTAADDALTFWVRDDSGKPRPMRVPLVDAGTLDRELGTSFQSSIPRSVRERLQQRGFDLQSKRRYAPLWLENGRPMIVPVEDTKIVPVNRNVY